jgi:putative methyltransferase (TIGR04325 family)
VKEFIKQLVPPVILNLLKTASAPRIFSSYDEAKSACGNDAFEDESLVRVVIEKSRIFRQTIHSSHTFPILDLGALRTLIALGLTESQGTLRVLDFGGGAGYHYTLAKAVLGSSKSLKWSVVETSVMAKEAQLLTDRGNLEFFDNIDDAKNNLGTVDLVFTSGALQYCPDPLKYLRELTNVGATNIFITRTPFNDSENSLISIQVSKLRENGPGPLPVEFEDRNVSYPITFASKHMVERILSEKYAIRFSVNEDKGTFSAKKTKVDMYGYFCVLK